MLLVRYLNKLLEILSAFGVSFLGHTNKQVCWQVLAWMLGISHNIGDSACRIRIPDDPNDVVWRLSAISIDRGGFAGTLYDHHRFQGCRD